MTRVEEVAQRRGIMLVNGRPSAGQYTRWVLLALVAQVLIIVCWPIVILGWLAVPAYQLGALAVWIASPVGLIAGYVIKARMLTVKQEFDDAMEYDRWA